MARSVRLSTIFKQLLQLGRDSESFLENARNSNTLTGEMRQIIAKNTKLFIQLSQRAATLHRAKRKHEEQLRKINHELSSLERLAQQNAR